MIISASRRTDIPAFYAEWFVNRIRAGYCTVPNPYNSNQVSYVSLQPDDVDAVVFWTRNPQPILPYLGILNKEGFRYYFQYTILGYPREIDLKSPALEASLSLFKKLSQRVGPDRVIWRYDPIVFSNRTRADYHRKMYSNIAESLEGYTRRSVISVMDFYKKSHKRLRGLAEKGFNIQAVKPEEGEFLKLMPDIKDIADTHDMEVVSCAEKLDLMKFGINPGKCIDDRLIAGTFNIEVASKKDPYQRDHCGCVESKDIGMYDSCLYGCQYCYATQSFSRAKKNYEKHDPESPSLIGWYEADPPEEDAQLRLFDG